MRLGKIRTSIYILGISVCAALLLCLTGCTYPDWAAGDEGAAYKIVCTTYPQYDWAMQVIGDSDDFDVKLLLRNGVDMHSYQPTVDDMYKISTADMFIYVGGSSDAWVSDALKNAHNDDMLVIDMMETIGDGAKVEELVEGMQDDEKESLLDRLFNRADSDEDGELEYDEHMWLSITNAILITKQIAQGIAELDSANAAVYLSNAESYIEKLSDLDTRYRQAVEASDSKAFLFGDRFPFRYLADEYGLTYYAAFPGCSAETEASFETVVFLSNKIDELGLNTIYVIENSDCRVADVIRQNAKSGGVQILTMNSMQSVTDKDIAAGASYLGYMEDNLSALRAGFN